MKRQLRLCVVLVICLVAGLASSALAETVKLTLQYRGGGARTETVMAWIEEFEERNPHIEVEFLPAPDGYRDKTMISWASGTGPDVTEIWGDWAQGYARSGALLDLRPYVERDFDASDIEDFWPTAWDASFLKYGPNAGIQFRIPRYMITTVFYFNKSLFDQAGMADPLALEESGEWTWETLRQVSKKLTVKRGEETSTYGFTTDSDSYRRLVTWVRANGGDFFDPDNPTDFIGDEPPAVEAITFLQDMIWQDGSCTPLFEREMFIDGRVAIMEEGNHAIFAKYKPNIGDSFEWNIAPKVVGRFGRKSYSGDDGFVIWKDTPHPEEAWELVKFLTSRRGQEIAAQYEGLAPVRRSVMPFYMGLDPNIRVDVLAANMADASDPISSYLVGDVSGIGKVMQQVLESCLETSEKSYTQAISEVADVIEKMASATSN